MSYVLVLRENYGWQVCEERLLELWPQPYHPTPQVEGDAAGVTTRGVRPRLPVNHTFFFLCHGFIKFMYINKYLWKQDFNVCILGVTMWTTFYPNQWVWILPVGVDFASGCGFCQWVWIWKPHRPDSLLYHVIYTQAWYNEFDLPMLINIPAKPLNHDIVSVHFNHFYCMGICNKLTRHLSMLPYIYLNVVECWRLTSYIYALAKV